MIISELPPPPALGNQSGAAAPLEVLKTLAKELATECGKSATTCLTRECLDELRAKVSELSYFQDLSFQDKKDCWQLAHILWNVSVDITNKGELEGEEELEENIARLRHIACDVLLIAGELEADVHVWKLTAIRFLVKTGIIWHKCMNYEVAEACFDKATEICSSLHDGRGPGTATSQPDHKEEQVLLFTLYRSRAKTAFELCQRTLACNLLGRARTTLSSMRDAESITALSEDFLFCGKALLEKGTVEESAESIPYMENALEICSSAITDPVHEETERGALSSLRHKVLRYLAAGQLENGNLESVLKCTSALKELSAAASCHPSIPFLTLKALAGLGRLDEAFRELESLIGNKRAGVPVCLSGLAAILEAESASSSLLEKALYALRERFPNDKSIPVYMVDKILYMKSGAAAARSDFLLSIVTNEDIVKLMGTEDDERDEDESEEDGSQQHCLHVLLWNAASDKFNNEEFEAAVKLFEASMLYVPPQKIGPRAKALRMLSICYMELQKYSQSLEYIEMAEQIEDSIASSYLKLKICLLTKAESAAMKQIERIMSCHDFDPQFLNLACHEAKKHGLPNVAITSLSKMLPLYSTERKPPMLEAVTVRNLITLHKDVGDMSAMLKCFRHAQARVAKVGSELFFGKDPAELRWFGAAAINEGVKAGSKNDWKLSASFLTCGADFYATLPDTNDNLHALHKTLVLAISAILLQGREIDGESLKHAGSLMERLAKVLGLLQVRGEMGDDNKFEVQTLLIQFELRGRMKDYKGQLELLQKCKSTSGFNVQLCLQMAEAALNGSYNHEVATAAFRASLEINLSSASPNYEMLATAIRQLIRIADGECRDGPNVLNLYNEAHQILQGLTPGLYPIQEVDWLISTAWNRAAFHAKFSRYEEAEIWMKVALGMLKHSPSLEASQSTVMNNALKQVVRKKDYASLSQSGMS